MGRGTVPEIKPEQLSSISNLIYLDFFCVCAFFIYVRMFRKSTQLLPQIASSFSILFKHHGLPCCS